MDQRNTIGVLSTTAAILLVGLVLVTTRPIPAIAAGMTATGGEFIMTVGTTPQTDEEYLYVVDVPTQKMAIYRFDVNKGVVDLVQGVDLSQFRQQPGQPPPGQPPGRRKP
jgi:hypothetical protein